MYSVDANKVVSFPRFRGSNSAPAWAPDGSQIMFSSSMLGNPELFVTDANGSRPKRLTYSSRRKYFPCLGTRRPARASYSSATAAEFRSST